eukprot:3379379-Prymnesium_polylepis.1
MHWYDRIVSRRWLLHIQWNVCRTTCNTVKSAAGANLCRSSQIVDAEAAKKSKLVAWALSTLGFEWRWPLPFATDAAATSSGGAGATYRRLLEVGSNFIAVASQASTTRCWAAKAEERAARARCRAAPGRWRPGSCLARFAS